MGLVHKDHPRNRRRLGSEVKTEGAIPDLVVRHGESLYLALAFEEFAWELPAYQNVETEPREARSVESAKRTFERDKAILLRMGIPLRCVKVDDDNDLERDGYTVLTNNIYSSANRGFGEEAS